MNAAFIRANMDTLKAVVCDAVFRTEVAKTGMVKKDLSGSLSVKHPCLRDLVFLENVKLQKCKLVLIE